MLFPEHSCAVLTVKFFLFLLSPCLNALLSLGSHYILNFRSNQLGTFTLCLVVVKDFVLSQLVELADLVLLGYYLIEVLQLFLIYQRASD